MLEKNWENTLEKVEGKLKNGGGFFQACHIEGTH